MPNEAIILKATVGIWSMRSGILILLPDRKQKEEDLRILRILFAYSMYAGVLRTLLFYLD